MLGKQLVHIIFLMKLETPVQTYQMMILIIESSGDHCLTQARFFSISRDFQDLGIPCKMIFRQTSCTSLNDNNIVKV